MSTDYGKILNALPRPDLYDSWELVKRHMPIEQPPASASYIVFQKGGQYYAKNGNTGHIEFGPGDASTVIQSAINALTLNRTWQETIMLKGNLGYVHDVEVPSYTRIIGDKAKLTLPSGSSYIFKQPNADITDVTFENIHFISETQYSGNGLEIFYFTGSTWRHAYYVTVKGCIFENFGDGIHAIADESIFTDNIFRGNGVGLYFDAGSTDVVTDNYFYVPSNKYALQLTDIATVSVVGNVFMGTDTSGAAFIKTWTAYMIDIVGNIFSILPNGYAIWFDPVNGTSSGINIEGNTFYSIGVGILTSYQAANYGIRIAGNLMAGNGGPPNKFGELFCFGPWGGNKAGEVHVEGNELWVSKAFESYGNAYTIILKNNNINANSPPTLGTGTLIAKGNIGYVTENSGTATFSGNNSQTQFAIAHGLVGTPKSWRVEAGSADAKGNKYVTADATNLTVTFATAPPSGTNNVVLVWQAEM